MVNICWLRITVSVSNWWALKMRIATQWESWYLQSNIWHLQNGALYTEEYQNNLWNVLKPKVTLFIQRQPETPGGQARAGIHGFCLFILWRQVSCSPDWSQTHYIDNFDLELLILLLPLSSTRTIEVCHQTCFHNWILRTIYRYKPLVKSSKTENTRVSYR